MRLFIAINFKEEIKNELSGIIQSLKSHTSQGNFTLRENLHLTLVFLGEIAPPKAESIAVVMSKVKREKFVLSLGGLGSFKRNGGDIYWLGVDKNRPLADLQRDIHQGLTEAGFALETREFKPHLTLGREIRVTSGFDRESFSKTIAPLNQEVEKISLMKSERINGKLTYTEIYAHYLSRPDRP